jgi:hypothetical protein
VDGKDARPGDRNAAVRHSLDQVRKRSLHRIWWNSARVALMRGHSGEPSHKPNGHRAIGKRV